MPETTTPETMTPETMTAETMTPETMTPETRVGPPPTVRTRWYEWGVFVLVASFAVQRVLSTGRGLTFFYDEWGWVFNRRATTAASFLDAHNGHLSLLPVAMYKVLFSVFGLTTYLPYRLLPVAGNLICATLTWRYLRRRTHPLVALCLASIILLLGAAWEDILWGFQIGFFGSVASAVGALLLLDRDDTLGDVGASVCLAISIACSGIGVAVLAAVFLELAWRRRTWRRLWIPLVPGAFYALWFLTYGDSQARSSNIHLVPEFVARASAGAAGALGGLSLDNGRFLMGVLVTVVLFKVVREHRVTPRLVCVLAIPGFFWVLTAISRAELNSPGSSRYLYPGAVFLALIVGELATNSRYLPIAMAVIVIATAYSIHGNLDALRDGRALMLDTTTHVRANLAALELARGHTDPSFRPDASRAPDITAGVYFPAIDSLGSPAFSRAELHRQSAGIRAEADDTLLRAIGAAVSPDATPAATAGPPPAVENATHGVAASTGSCVVFAPTSPGASVELSAAGPHLVITASPSAPVLVSVRRLADLFPATPLGSVAPGQRGTLALPALPAGPWHLRLSSDAPVRACTS
ncbi:MAG: hypothetical protein U0V73_04885 [Acidimicrobiia bacterium]